MQRAVKPIGHRLRLQFGLMAKQKARPLQLQVYRIPNPQYNESANSVKYLSAFTSGGGIVDVQGRALQGLKVNIISSNKTIYAIIKFENSKWTSTIYEG